MKICIDISQIVYPGGVGEYTKKLVENLLKIDRKNSYRLLAYSLKQKARIEAFTKTLSVYHNWQLEYFPWPVSLVEMTANRVRWPSLEQLVGRVDIYHASDWVQFPAKAKIVTTVHDLAPIIYPEFHDKKIVQVHRRRLELTRKYADWVITVSESTRNDFLKRYDFPEEKVKVIYEAPVIKPELFIRKQVLNQVQDNERDKPYILTVSSLNPRKNIHRLVTAFGIFRQAHPEYRLVVAGSYGWGERFKDQEGIIFKDNINREQLARYYQDADLFVYPSLYEGFGLPVLEAMSFGVPVVASNISSLPEIGGKAAVLVDPESEKAIAQGMEKALQEISYFARQGKERAKQFSWEKCARETLKIYEKVGRDKNC